MVPHTFETMYVPVRVPQARKHVPCALETMAFHLKFDPKNWIAHQCLKIKKKV